jgi:hypothetical protein
MTILLIAAALNVLAKSDAKPAVKQPVFEYKVISDDSMQIAGSIYTFVEGAYTWETAKQKAASLGGELVVIHHRQINDLLYKMVKDFDGKILIGCYKLGKDWKWTDGTNVNLANFSKSKKNTGKFLFFEPKVSGSKWSCRSEDDGKKMSGPVFDGFIYMKLKKITPMTAQQIEIADRNYEIMQRVKKDNAERNKRKYAKKDTEQPVTAAPAQTDVDEDKTTTGKEQ